VAACGARAVLVGEALVREGDPATKVAELASVALP
jgi:indole-3-glycerol phosphate synthase